jgi:outer membrane receptor protein involved in Fe transport
MKKSVSIRFVSSRLPRLNPKNLNRTLFLLASLAVTRSAVAQSAPTGAPADTGSPTNAVTLGTVKVVGHLDEAREQIVPSLGATSYSISADQIDSIAQGGNAPLNEIILRAPGVAQDSAVNGGLHVRGEHANLQYRINDVLLPEGITGFGLELDPRFISSMSLVTGSLPAQYGFRTAGIVDIHTKSGAFENGGDVGMYGGSYGTIRPSMEYGGTAGKLSYFIGGSYDHNELGIENVTPSHNAIHDVTDQGKLFSYLSYLVDDTSRFNVILSASDSQFQVPNTPGLPAGTSPNGTPWVPGFFDSSQLNERQNEQNYYVVGTFQKEAGDLDYQVSAFGRNSGVHFMPDPLGDLYFNGVASDVKRELYSGGLQGDGSYAVGDKHTIRAGFIFLDESVNNNSPTTVFPVDGGGNPTGPAFTIPNRSTLHGIFAGLYLQDEWKILPKVTLNFGARFDVFDSSFDHENQLSPRVNLIYEVTDKTTLHAGYARYFTPPPVENVPAGTVALSDNTSNASATDQDNSVKAERSNYFDAGLSHKLAPGWTVGVDGYYKRAHNQLDDGLFGQTLILSAFNYEEGRVYGMEVTTSYIKGGFSSYANISTGQAYGKNIVSAQFLFNPDDLAYIHNHFINLDHEQLVSGSFGVSYTWNETQSCSTRVYADSIYASGLRTDGGGFEPNNPANPIPNGAKLPGHYSVNLGVEQSFKLSERKTIKARVDVVNVTDNIYQIRDGAGVGVNAAAYGERLGIFGSISFVF